MAEASDDSLVTPTKNDGSVNNDSSGDQDSASNGRITDAHNLRASVGSLGREHSSLRSSADKLGSANGNQKVVPHYLRASTGSCHDFCKFGKHHSDESKARKPFRKRIAKLSPDQIPVEIRVASDKKKKEIVLSGEEAREVAAGGKKKEVVFAGGKKKEVVAAGGKKKEEVVAGGKKKKEVFLSGEEEEREVVTSGKVKREVVADGKKKEVVVAGDKKKEKVVAGDEKKEEVALSDEEKREVVESDKKKEEVVTGEEKKEEMVAGDEKREEVVAGDEKKEEVVASDEIMEEVVSGVETKDEFVNHEPPIEAKVRSSGLKSSLDTKSYPSKPKISLSKEKATKHTPSTYTKNTSPSVPSSNSQSDLRKPKLSTYTKMYSSKQNGSSCSKTLLPKCKSSSAKKSPSVDPPEIVKSVFFPYTEVEDSVKQGSSTDDKISRTEKKATSAPKQRSSPVKLKPVKVKPSYSPNDSDGMHGKGRSNSNVQTDRKLMTAKASAKKILTPPSATLLSKLPLKKTAEINSGRRGNLKLVSPLTDRNRIRRVNTKASGSEKVTEKKLYVIRVGAGNNASVSISGDNVMSSPLSPLSAESSSHGKSVSLSSHEDDNSEVEESSVKTHKLISKNSLKTVIEAPVKEKPKKAVRKSRLVVAGDKHISPVKVKFRMGKVVELQSDNNTPRKLTFRRARVLGVEESNLRRKTTKKAGVTSDTAGTGVLPQKVVLKHQNVQGKKDAQGLLNNVIEETASKLAVSRKSKVKALVGAFETVISLHESKPSTQVSS
ncbi:hypothetical protein AAHA92_27463 [Salvia divinorum]|uniref:Calmodulin-binding domain-containing protein n=1 Tax=Salvia divinorum TaxID=28513 RepID=A0ABD1G4F5_SALDI